MTDKHLQQRFHTRVGGNHNSNSLIAVRYFLERPGFDLNNATVRLWSNPPEVCRPEHVQEFLIKQGIIDNNDNDQLLVEVFLDRFQAYMTLDMCKQSGIEWEFSKVMDDDPTLGRLDIRLTDVNAVEEKMQSSTSSKSSPTTSIPIPEQANTSPVGLFSFSMAIAMETMALMAELDETNAGIAPSWAITRAPYTLFVGGILQFVVGIFQVLRGNIYGATAFLAFGAFLTSDGAGMILRLYFTTPDTLAFQYVGEGDDWGWFIRHVYILAFVCALCKQTLVMNKLTTTLIVLLIIKLIFTCVAVWDDTIAWIQVGLGWILSVFAFYVFFAEFTNEVYHREVFPVYKWSVDHSPDEVFGAVGRVGGLHPRSTAMALRRARVAAVEAVNNNNHAAGGGGGEEEERNVPESTTAAVRRGSINNNDRSKSQALSPDRREVA